MLSEKREYEGGDSIQGLAFLKRAHVRVMAQECSCGIGLNISAFIRPAARPSFAPCS